MKGIILARTLDETFDTGININVKQYLYKHFVLGIYKIVATIESN